MHVRRCSLHSDHVTQTQWEQGVPFEKGCVLLKYSRHQQVVLLAWATETELECFSNNAKTNIHGSYFLLTRQTPETPPAREPSWVRTSSLLGREGKRLCGVEDETKTSWCSKSVWVQRCWYVKLKIECWRIWKCSGLFLCPGLLLDSSSSRRSRTSVMKQGWPQLPLKHNQSIWFPQSDAWLCKVFFSRLITFFCAFFCRSVWALIPSFDFFSHVNQDLKTQLERMQWVWWFAYAKLPETGSDSTCRTAEGFSKAKILLQKSRLDCLRS